MKQRKRTPKPRTPVAESSADLGQSVINTWLLVFMKTRPDTDTASTLLSYCREQFWWRTVIDMADSVEHYEVVLRCVLNDGNLTKGQQQVLELYTREVCAQHLPIATAVWTLYTQNTVPQNTVV